MGDDKCFDSCQDSLTERTKVSLSLKHLRANHCVNTTLSPKTFSVSPEKWKSLLLTTFHPGGDYKYIHTHTHLSMLKQGR